MNTIIDVKGFEIEARELLSVLQAAAKNGVPIYQLQGDGPGWAGMILAAIPAQGPSYEALREAVAVMLRGPNEEARFAARHLVGDRPETVDKQQILEAARRAELADLRGWLLAKLGSNLRAGRDVYSQDLRAFADDAELDEELADVFLIFDHAWYLPRLIALPFEAATKRILAASPVLTNAEMAALATELEAHPESNALAEWMRQGYPQRIPAGDASNESIRWR